MINRIFSIHVKELAIIAVMILQISFFILCMAMIFSHMSVKAGSSRERERIERYKSVFVCSGESLWEISGRYYSDEYKSMDLYIKKIMRLNNMTDGHINSGAYLLIPYYE